MALSKTYDGDEPVRVNKWLAQSGVCSRREADALIAEGRVRIDGESVTDAGHKILPGQTLTVDQGGTAQLESRFTVVYNKPVGIVSGQPEPGENCDGPTQEQNPLQEPACCRRVVPCRPA